MEFYLAIAGELPCTVVCRDSRKTTRRYPRRCADESAASGLDVADLAEFTAGWRARVTGGRPVTARRAARRNRAGHRCASAAGPACTPARAKFAEEHRPGWFR